MARHGPDKEICGAQRPHQEPGVLCQNTAGTRTDHLGFGRCYLHGGSTESHNKAALREQVDAEVRSQLGLTDWEPIVDPFSALADHAGKGAAIEEILRLKVEELSSLKQYGGDIGDRISVIFEAWERSYSRLSSNLQAMARLSLEDRIASVQSKIDETTAALVSSALDSALNAGNLDQTVREAILREFGNQLRDQATVATRQTAAISA